MFFLARTNALICNNGCYFLDNDCDVVIGPDVLTNTVDISDI